MSVPKLPPPACFARKSKDGEWAEIVYDEQSVEMWAYGSDYIYTAEQMEAYATAAILADRADRESAGAVAWHYTCTDPNGTSRTVVVKGRGNPFGVPSGPDEDWAGYTVDERPLVFANAHPLPESALRALVEAVSKHVKLWEDGMDDDDSAISLRAALAQPELLKWLGRAAP